jgi:glycosyltransferase involved in cell wall biosynthesis
VAARSVCVERIWPEQVSGDEPVVFSGLASYGPNREALAFLFSRVMPPLVARRPRAILAVTGGAVDADAPWLRGLGLVPFRDLPGVIGACRVAVAPVFSGSGTRLKILEAMAAGVPVVATSKAAEGLPLANGTHLLLADSAADFVRAIERFLGEPDYASRVAGAARKLVCEKFAWPAIVADFVTHLGERIAERRAATGVHLPQCDDSPSGERVA